MEVALSEQFTAPVPLGKQWWDSLTNCQKLCLVIVVVQFSLGAILTYAALCIDEIYSVKIVVIKIEPMEELPKPVPPTGVIATCGYWRWRIRNVTDLVGMVAENDKMIYQGHFHIATDLFNNCIHMSPRLGALRNLAGFFALLTTGIVLFFQASLVLFRVHFLLAMPLTLMTACLSLLFAKMASIEQLSCLEEASELWGRNSGGVWLLRSRLFEFSLSFSGASIETISAAVALFFLPVSVLGSLLVFVNRKHL